MGTTAEVVDRINAGGKALICLDACAVLDIVRDPAREKFSGDHTRAAVELLGWAEGSPPHVSLLMSETVRGEIHANLAQVEDETMRSLRRLDEAVGRAWMVMKAVDRVSRVIAPATRAKQSVKDCLIVETYLRVARELRAAEFGERIVLLTTNTADFTSGSRSNPRDEFVGDFGLVGMTLATDFLMARYAL